MTTIRKPYERVPRVRISFQKPTRTKQSFQNECDINRIMRRFEKTGLVEHVNRHRGDYGDFMEAPAYHEAMNRVASAQAAFMSLPARVRQRFGNDAGMFLAFVQDPKNIQEMVSLGLAKLAPAEPKGDASADKGGQKADQEAAASPAPTEGAGKKRPKGA